MKYLPHQFGSYSFVLMAVLLLGVTIQTEPGGTASHRQALPLSQETLQDLRIGHFYPAGLRVRSPQLGISFVVPRDWRVRLAPGAGVIHMDSARKQGIGIIHLLEDVTREDVETRLSEPQSFEAAFVLDPTTAVTIKGNQLSSTYQHGDQIGQARAILGPGSQAVVFLLAGPITERTYFSEMLSQLSASTDFLGPEQAELLKTWYHHLNGNQVTGLAATPSTQGHQWHFCGTGRFVHQFHPAFSESQQAGSDDSTGFEEAGPWHIDIQDKKVVLVVTPDFALPRSFTLRKVGDHLTFNDEPFMTERSHTCF